jgi:hypothetical protein
VVFAHKLVLSGETELTTKETPPISAPNTSTCRESPRENLIPIRSRTHGKGGLAHVLVIPKVQKSMNLGTGNGEQRRRSDDALLQAPEGGSHLAPSETQQTSTHENAPVVHQGGRIFRRRRRRGRISG